MKTNSNGVCYFSGTRYRGEYVPSKFRFKRKGETKQKIDFVKFMIYVWDKKWRKARKEFDRVEKNRKKWIDMYSNILGQYGDF